MKKASRVIKDQILTEKDFREGLKDEKIKKFVDMLSSNLYSFRVKAALYADKKISARGFLYNDNIYNLPLGKKNDKGQILIDNSLLEIFDRYLLSEDMTMKGDALTAFMLDHDDSLYAVLRENMTAKDKMTSQEYIQIFSRAYNTTSEIILEHKINMLVSTDPALISITTSEELMADEMGKVNVTAISKN